MGIIVTPNYSLKKVGYKVESTAGTKIITNAADTTYDFGGWIEDQTELPKITRSRSNAYVYNSREISSSTTVIDPKSMTAMIKNYIPFLCTPFNRLLGSPTDAAPDTIQVLDSGLKKSYTVHGEHNDGTNPFTRDLVGAYTTGLKWHIEVGQPLIIDEEIFNGWSIQDEDSSTASVHLTSDPTNDNVLPFIGINEIKWDTAGDNETLANIYRIDFESTQDFTSTIVTGTGANAARKVFPTGRYHHKALFSGVLDTHNQYDDLRQGNQVNVTATSQKADGSDYVKFLMNGVNILSISKPIPRGGGYVERLFTVEYNSLSLQFDDGVSVFGTYYS